MMSARIPVFSKAEIALAQHRAMVLAEDNSSPQRAKAMPVVWHICPYCEVAFIGVKQKRYHDKSCVEAACRVRKSALVDALAQQFARYGLSRAQVEVCADTYLERCQTVAAAFGLAYCERDRVWRKSSDARVLRSV